MKVQIEEYKTTGHTVYTMPVISLPDGSLLFRSVTPDYPRRIWRRATTFGQAKAVRLMLEDTFYTRTFQAEVEVTDRDIHPTDTPHAVLNDIYAQYPEFGRP